MYDDAVRAMSLISRSMSCTASRAHSSPPLSPRIINEKTLPGSRPSLSSFLALFLRGRINPSRILRCFKMSHVPTQFDSPSYKFAKQLVSNLAPLFPNGTSVEHQTHTEHVKARMLRTGKRVLDRIDGIRTIFNDAANKMKDLKHLQLLREYEKGFFKLLEWSDCDCFNFMDKGNWEIIEKEVEKLRQGAGDLVRGSSSGDHVDRTRGPNGSRLYPSDFDVSVSAHCERIRSQGHLEKDRARPVSSPRFDQSKTSPQGWSVSFRGWWSCAGAEPRTRKSLPSRRGVITLMTSSW